MSITEAAAGFVPTPAAVAFSSSSSDPASILATHMVVLMGVASERGLKVSPLCVDGWTVGDEEVGEPVKEQSSPL